MEVDISTVLNFLIIAITSAVSWQFRRLISRVDRLVIDVELIKQKIENYDKDHDKVICMDAAVKAAHRRIDKIERAS